MAKEDDAHARSGRKPGRRPHGVDNRATILNAARTLFGSAGYDATTIRAVAAKAQVDPALVMQFYGNKEGLFQAVLSGLTQELVKLLKAAKEHGVPDAEFFARAYLSIWESPETGDGMRTLVRAAIGSQRATELLRQFIIGPESALRIPTGAIAVAGAQLLGIAIARYVIEMPPLVAMNFDELVEAIAPSIQLQVDRQQHG